jgi:ABC-2 type transport system ATP-binding protein
MAEHLIELRKLVKRFGPVNGGILAVDNVSFSVSPGEVLGFLGPNGAGKSTTMKMITGFLTPTSGAVLVAGHDVAAEPLKAKEQIGYLPEGAPGYPDMTPASFLAFCAEVRGLSGEAKRKAVGLAVKRTNLEGVLRQPIETLSKGFKRRVGLAQAILHEPRVLILDEPTDGLDPNQKHEVRNLIREMARAEGEKGKAIVLSTHILEEVEAVCTRAIIIAGGRVVADATPKELAKRHPSGRLEDVFRDLTARKPVPEKRGARPEVAV